MIGVDYARLLAGLPQKTRDEVAALKLKEQQMKKKEETVRVRHMRLRHSLCESHGRPRVLAQSVVLYTTRSRSRPSWKASRRSRRTASWTTSSTRCALVWVRLGTAVAQFIQLSAFFVADVTHRVHMMIWLR